MAGSFRIQQRLFVILQHATIYTTRTSTIISADIPTNGHEHAPGEPQNALPLAPTAPPGAVAPRPRHPQANITQAEKEKRLALGEYCIINRYRTSQINAIFKQQCGISHVNAHSWVLRAKKAALERTNRPKEDHVLEAHEFYSNLIANTKKLKTTTSKTLKDGTVVETTRERFEVTNTEKMQAYKAIREMLGLDAPVKVMAAVRGEINVTDNAQYDKMSEEQLVQLMESRQRMLEDIVPACLPAEVVVEPQQITEGNGEQ